MKLLNYTSIRYLLFTALLLLISIPVSYVVLNRIFIKAVDRDLYLQAHEIPLRQNYIRSERELELWKTLDKDLEILPADSVRQEDHPYTERNSVPGKKKMQDFRILQKQIHILGKRYVVEIKSSLIEKEDLIRTILLIQLTLFFLLLLGAALMNYFINKKVWRSFYITLTFLENFKLEGNSVLAAGRSGIQEFRKLEHSVRQLAIGVRRAYQSQKEFTENASHELQTPLAILKSKLELLLQEKDLSQHQSMLIGDMYSVIERLEDMNVNLLFLSKIENSQFAFNESFIAKEVVREAADELQFMIHAKAQRLENHLSPLIIFKGNRHLFKIMVANLLRNAIQYSAEGSVITLQADKDDIMVTNPGKPLQLHPDKIFDRFTKSRTLKGNGLGLAIAKKIAELHGLDLSYSFNAGLHAFHIRR